MLRHAEWRGERERRGFPVNDILFFLAVVSAFAILFTLLRKGGMGVAFVCFTFTIFLIATRFGTRASRRLQERIDPGEREVPVRAIYRKAGGLSLGSEEGSLALVDGWLVFRGERTDWSVRREDVQDLDKSLAALGLVYPTGLGRDHIASLTPLAPYGRGMGRRDAAAL